MAITCDYCNTVLGPVFSVYYENKKTYYKCTDCVRNKVSQPIADKQALQKQSHNPTNNK